MPSSKLSRTEPLPKAILRSGADNESVILDYKPLKIDFATREEAIRYIKAKSEKKTDFEMDDSLRQQTGVKQIESDNQEAIIDQMVVERLGKIQEQAYKQAYDLGLEEGHKLALQEKSKEIEKKFSELESLFQSILDIKIELAKQNERHIVDLAFKIGKKIAGCEVKANADVILQLIQKSVELAHREEDIKVKVSEEQLKFIEELKSINTSQKEYLNKVKLVSDDKIKTGGCIVETNYGIIDNQLETRVEQLWKSFSDNLYQQKDIIKSE
jgi:flagellar assembly protein FliH